MRKRLSFLLVYLCGLVSLAFVLVSCGIEEEAPVVDYDVQIEVNIDDADGVMEICIINTGDELMSCGLYYEIEVFKKNKWTFFRTCGPVDLLLQMIPAHEQYIQVVNISGSNSIPPGTYRVVKTICNEVSDDEFEVYSHEFVID